MATYFVSYRSSHGTLRGGAHRHIDDLQHDGLTTEQSDCENDVASKLAELGALIDFWLTAKIALASGSSSGIGAGIGDRS